MSAAVRFYGRVRAVRARLLLTKFAGETTAKSAGYLIVLEGTATLPDGKTADGLHTIAFGPATVTQKHLGAGDLLRGEAHPVPADTPDTLADFYRVGILRTIAHAGEPGASPVPPPDPPRTDPPLTVEAMENAPRRALHPDNLSENAPCHICPYGTIVAVVRLTDPRNYKSGAWSHIPACLGPDTCPHYRQP